MTKEVEVKNLNEHLASLRKNASIEADNLTSLFGQTDDATNVLLELSAKIDAAHQEHALIQNEKDDALRIIAQAREGLDAERAELKAEKDAHQETIDALLSHRILLLADRVQILQDIEALNEQKRVLEIETSNLGKILLDKESVLQEIEVLNADKLGVAQVIEGLKADAINVAADNTKALEASRQRLKSIEDEIATRNESLASFNENVAKVRDELDTRWKDLTILQSRLNTQGMNVQMPEIKIPDAPIIN